MVKLRYNTKERHLVDLWKRNLFLIWWTYI